jgi:hypothetical protein
MRIRLAAILLAGTASLALIASATSSSAITTQTTTWTVTPGGSATGVTSLLTLTDSVTGSDISCPDDVPYYLHHHGPNPYGTIEGVDLGTCTGPLELSFTIEAAALPWDLNGTSYNPGTGVTTGTVTGIHLTVSGSSCNFSVDGTSAGADNGQVADTYTNSTAKLNYLTTGGNLHLYDVSGCSGLFDNGNAATLSASYTLSPAQVVSSP